MTNKTIGSSGADYTTLQAAHDGLASNPTDDYTFTVITIGNIGGATLSVSNSGNHTFLVTVQSGVRYYNGASWSKTTSGGMSAALQQGAYLSAELLITGTGWTLEWLAYTPANVTTMALSNTCTIRKSVIQIAAFPRAGCLITAGTVTMDDVAISANEGFQDLNCSGGTLNAYHVSVNGSDNDSAISQSVTGTFNCYGCVVKKYAGNAYGGTIGGDYNVSNDATAPGANSYQSQSSFFVSAASLGTTFNLHLPSGKANTYGTPYDSTTLSNLATDIENESRPSSTTDAGCDQITSSSPPAPPLPNNANFSRRGKGRTLPTPATIGH